MANRWRRMRVLLPGLAAVALVVALGARRASADELLGPPTATNERRSADERTEPRWVCTATDMVIADLDQSDAERGLGRGGAVVSAMERAVRQSGAAPSQGVADIELVLRTDGSQSLKVLASSGNGWESFGAGVEHLVAKSDVRIPDKSLGLQFVIRVETTLVYADGCVASRSRRAPVPAATASVRTPCGTRGVPLAEPHTSCGSRRGRRVEATHLEVHARIVSEARLPDPNEPRQRVKR
jgi:hypothetical protein